MSLPRLFGHFESHLQACWGSGHSSSMSNRSLYLYQPLGGHCSNSSQRDRLTTPVRCIGILLTIVLSILSLGLYFIPRPWSSLVLPVTFIPPHKPLQPPIPPVLEVLAAIVYNPFIPPTPAQSLANQTVRPIKAHSLLSPECLNTWVSSGIWQEPCRHHMVQDAQIDLVYSWVNGS